LKFPVNNQHVAVVLVQTIIKWAVAIKNLTITITKTSAEQEAVLQCLEILL